MAAAHDAVPFGSICHDCKAEPGELHQDGCDVEQCPACGGQMITCGCPVSTRWGSPGRRPPDQERLPWTGEWPGAADCREYGFWCRWEDGKAEFPHLLGKGWTPCSATDPGAREHLGRLHEECRWDPKRRRFVLMQRLRSPS